MRNFSSVSRDASTFLSLVDKESMIGDPAVILTSVLESLARAFESPLPAVKHAFGQIWTSNEVVGGEIHPLNNCRSIETNLPPSELVVLGDLHSFFYLAKSRWEDWMDYPESSIAFSYFNLNTGASVVWISSNVVGE